MHKLLNKNITIKQLISWVVGFPSGMIVLSELNDLSLWWVQFLALGLLVAVLYWNGAFIQEEYQPKTLSRRRF